MRTAFDQPQRKPGLVDVVTIALADLAKGLDTDGQLAGHEDGFRVQGSGFRVQGSGFRVQGSVIIMADGCQITNVGYRRI